MFQGASSEDWVMAHPESSQLEDEQLQHNNHPNPNPNNIHNNNVQSHNTSHMSIHEQQQYNNTLQQLFDMNHDNRQHNQQSPINLPHRHNHNHNNNSIHSTSNNGHALQPVASTANHVANEYSSTSRADVLHSLDTPLSWQPPGPAAQLGHHHQTPSSETFGAGMSQPHIHAGSGPATGNNPGGSPYVQWANGVVTSGKYRFARFCYGNDTNNLDTGTSTDINAAPQMNSIPMNFNMVVNHDEVDNYHNTTLQNGVPYSMSSSQQAGFPQSMQHSANIQQPQLAPAQEQLSYLIQHPQHANDTLQQPQNQLQAQVHGQPVPPSQFAYQQLDPQTLPPQLPANTSHNALIPTSENSKAPIHASVKRSLEDSQEQVSQPPKKKSTSRQQSKPAPVPKTPTKLIEYKVEQAFKKFVDFKTLHSQFKQIILSCDKAKFGATDPDEVQVALEKALSFHDSNKLWTYFKGDTAFISRLRNWLAHTVSKSKPNNTIPGLKVLKQIPRTETDMTIYKLKKVIEKIIKEGNKTTAALGRAVENSVLKDNPQAHAAASNKPKQPQDAKPTEKRLQGKLSQEISSSKQQPQSEAEIKLKAQDQTHGSKSQSNSKTDGEKTQSAGIFGALQSQRASSKPKPSVPPISTKLEKDKERESSIERPAGSGSGPTSSSVSPPSSSFFASTLDSIRRPKTTVEKESIPVKKPPAGVLKKKKKLKTVHWPDEKDLTQIKYFTPDPEMVRNMRSVGSVKEMDMAEANSLHHNTEPSEASTKTVELVDWRIPPIAVFDTQSTAKNYAKTGGKLTAASPAADEQTERESQTLISMDEDSSPSEPGRRELPDNVTSIIQLASHLKTNPAVLLMSKTGSVSSTPAVVSSSSAPVSIPVTAPTSSSAPPNASLGPVSTPAVPTAAQLSQLLKGISSMSGMNPFPINNTTTGPTTSSSVPAPSSSFTIPVPNSSRTVPTNSEVDPNVLALRRTDIRPYVAQDITTQDKYRQVCRFLSTTGCKRGLDCPYIHPR